MEKDIPPENTMLAIIRNRDVFNIMLKAIRATKILEIGTSAGYSTRRKQVAKSNLLHNR